jgi:hypothetical protein
MACNEPCLPCIPLTPCVDCPPPMVDLPCVNGETCEDLYNARCVEYKGAALSNIGVLPKDRLDEILTKLNVNHTSSGINIGNTNSILLTGAGTVSDPLKANAFIDPVTNNLIVATVTGLKVQFTKQNILSLFTMIEGDADLQAGFCSLITNCSNGVCGVPTGISATMV